MALMFEASPSTGWRGVYYQMDVGVGVHSDTRGEVANWSCSACNKRLVRAGKQSYECEECGSVVRVIAGGE